MHWLVCQVNTTIRCKHINLLEKKPGAVSGCETKVIYVHMLSRVGNFHEQSTMHNICVMWAKFNDILSDAVAKVTS